MNGLVGHQEVFADFRLGPGSDLRGGVLDFADDKASSVPAGAEVEEGRRKRWLEAGRIRR